MIDKSKTYKTRDGREVRIYATDGDNNKTIHGAVFENGWQFRLWYADGSYNGPTESNLDLIEVRPRHKRTVWLNVYPDKHGDYSQQKSSADAMAGEDRIACIKVELDFAEGDGL